MIRGFTFSWAISWAICPWLHAPAPIPSVREKSDSFRNFVHIPRKRELGPRRALGLETALSCRLVLIRIRQTQTQLLSELPPRRQRRYTVLQLTSQKELGLAQIRTHRSPSACPRNRFRTFLSPSSKTPSLESSSVSSLYSLPSRLPLHMYAFYGLHTEDLRTPPSLRRLGDALDELINLAKPPKSLALPEEVRTAAINWIEGWRKDVLEFVIFERIDKRGRYSKFCQDVRNYTTWLQAGIDSGHAMHSDVLVAVVSSVPSIAFGRYCSGLHDTLSCRHSDEHRLRQLRRQVESKPLGPEMYA